MFTVMFILCDSSPGALQSSGLYVSRHMQALAASQRPGLQWPPATSAAQRQRISHQLASQFSISTWAVSSFRWQILGEIKIKKKKRKTVKENKKQFFWLQFLAKQRFRR